MVGEMFYLCDGKDEKCKDRRWNCYKTGGDCYHTCDINHAKNFYLGADDKLWEDETGERIIAAVARSTKGPFSWQ